MASDLRSVVTKLYDALSDEGDLDEARRWVDTSGDTVHIGTDAGEWINGGSVLLERLREQRDAGVRLVARDLRVEQEGTVGWAVDRPALTLPDGAVVECRLTLVFVQRSNDWLLTHSHLSMPVPDSKLEP